MQTLRASDFGLTPERLSFAILEVLDTLVDAGFEAYIVGGGVRDLLLGMRPKDFDAVTNATPAQIKQVFGRRCRIIGRRFELAHVYIGRDMIEVATFRAPPRQGVTTASGMITRDNVWGTIQQDFARRDFSINTLYYQPRHGVILDFCHAMADIQKRQLRLIGEPRKRFEEDPVRILRVLRFAAKLEFQIDPAILAQLTPAMTRLLREVSPHRLYDESQKMLGGGHLTALLPLLIEYHVWPQLFADVPAEVTPFIQRAAHNTDQRIAQDKTVNPAFFYAVLLWETFLAREKQLRSRVSGWSEAMITAGIDVLKRQQPYTAIPRFAEQFIREVWELQPRLTQPKPRQVMHMLAHPRFRAAYDFLYLRELCGDVETRGMGEWWHEFQTMDNDTRESAIKLLNRHQQRQRRQNAAEERTRDREDWLEEGLGTEEAVGVEGDGIAHSASALAQSAVEKIPSGLAPQDGTADNVAEPVLGKAARRRRNRREAAAAFKAAQSGQSSTSVSSVIRQDAHDDRMAGASTAWDETDRAPRSARVESDIPRRMNRRRRERDPATLIILSRSELGSD